MFKSLRKSLKFWVLGMVAGVLAAPAESEIYTYRDSNGVLHITNVPTSQAYKPYRNSSRKSGRYYAVKDENGRWVARSSYYKVERLPKKELRERYAKHVREAARRFGVEESLLHAVITAESNYNSKAVSSVGAQGLMQLMPATAKRFGVRNIRDPKENIYGGAKYLRYLLDLFEGDKRLAIAAYNAGEGAVIKHGYRVPPYKQTIAYVPKVLAYYDEYRNL